MATVKSAEKDPGSQGGFRGGSSAKSAGAESGGGSQDCRTAGAREADWAKTARAGSSGSQPRRGPTEIFVTAEFHRSRKSDYAGWSAQGEFPAGLQCSGGGGERGTNHRGRRDNATKQRQTAVGADAATGDRERAWQTTSGQCRHGLLERGERHRGELARDRPVCGHGTTAARRDQGRFCGWTAGRKFGLAADARQAEDGGW